MTSRCFARWASRVDSCSSAVAWQASVAGAIGAIFGIPLGILARTLALDTIREQHLRRAASDRSRSLALLIVALSALVLANVVAALPGRSAARTSAAQVLRGE